MTFSRVASALAILSTVTLAACVSSEQRAIESYFTEAQEIAEGLVEAAAKFETLMNVQADPLVWSDEAKAELAAVLDSFQDLRSQAEDMSVPPAFTEVHPLLVESLGDMTSAVQIIDGIAQDPSTATEAKADEMTVKAENAERLAGEYVQKLEETLETKYPEMLEE